MRKTSPFEKFVYSIGDSGSNFIWTFTSSFLSIYYTDSVLLSATLVGTMMVITRLLDGVSDILFGLVIEKTRTKLGKARPWFGLSIIPTVVTFLLMFNVPNVAPSAKWIYVIITYFMMTVVTYTVNNLSYHAMLARISLEKDDRNKISAVRGIFAFVTGLVLAVVTTKLLSAFGGEKEQTAWTAIAFIYGGVCILFQAVCFFGTKEKISAFDEEKPQRSENVKLGIKNLLNTKYFYLAVLTFVFSFMISGSMLGTAVYYTRDVLGDSGYYVYVALAYVVPMVVGMLVVSALVRKFGKKNVMLFSSLLAIVGNIIGLLMPYSLTGVLIATAIGSLGSAPFSSLMFTMAPDIVDYLEKRTGQRFEGLATSANSFGLKVGTGLGSAMIGWCLGIGGYKGELAVQPDSALVAEIVLLFVLPLVCNVARTVIMAFWNIEKEQV